MAGENSRTPTNQLPTPEEFAQRRISKLYMLGFSKTPFKDPKPKQPPRRTSQPTFEELKASPGAVVEWIASDGRKARIHDTYRKLNASASHDVPKVPEEKAHSTHSRTKDRVHSRTRERAHSTHSRRRASTSAVKAPSVANDDGGFFGGMGGGLFEPESEPVKKAPSTASHKKESKAQENGAAASDNKHGFTKEQDDTIMRMKTENAGVSWDTIATEVGKTGPLCKERFNAIKPAGWKPAAAQGKGEGKKKEKGAKGKGKQEEVKNGAGGGDNLEKQNGDNNGPVQDWNTGAWDNDNQNGTAGKNGGMGDWDAAQQFGGDATADNNQNAANNAAGNWDTQGWGEDNNNSGSKSQKAASNNGNGRSKKGSHSGSVHDGGGSWENNPWPNTQNAENNTNWNTKPPSNSGRSHKSQDKPKDSRAPSNVPGYQELYPDDTFSMDDLKVIAKFMRVDHANMWMRMQSFFRDKTGRNLDQDVFRAKLEGKPRKG